MKLNTAPIDFERDHWVVYPQVEGAENFADTIAEALDNISDIADAVFYRFDPHVCSNFAVLEVEFEDESDSIAYGIHLSLPEWDGESFDFYGAGRLTRLLAAFKKALPEIEFTRNDGQVIELV